MLNLQRNDLILEYCNHNYFKSAVSFFSSTNVETKKWNGNKSR